jgi:hypothetical protein
VPSAVRWLSRARKGSTTCKLDEQEAKAEALELTRTETTNQLQERPLQSLSWNDLDQLAEEGSELALEAWDRIKAEVREELD